VTYRRIRTVAVATPAFLIAFGALLTALSLERDDPTAETAEFALLPLIGLLALTLWTVLARRHRTIRPERQTPAAARHR
jgi:hypothetical protein